MCEDRIAPADLSLPILSEHVFFVCFSAQTSAKCAPRRFITAARADKATHYFARQVKLVVSLTQGLIYY